MKNTPATDRFESLDVLRGVAILGIFAVNILGFAFPFYALSNPTAFPEAMADGGAFWWTVSTAGFQFKFVTIFSALFGAGIVLMLGEDANTEKLSLHHRRMRWLLLIGLAHAYLVWYGDILVPYAVAGFLIAGARVWPPTKLYKVGAALILGTYSFFVLQEFGFLAMDAEMRAETIAEMWAPPPDQINAHIASYRGNIIERLPRLAEDTLMAQLTQGVILLPRTIGVMMIGMGLFKSGFFTLRWRTQTYVAAGLIAASLGLAGSIWSVRQNFDVGFDLFQIGPGQSALYWTSLPQAFGYAALVMALCAAKHLAPVRAPFAAAGRMALSNYLLSSLFAAALFFGPPGFGKIGAMTYGDLSVIVAALWVLILTWSPIWLKFFQFGPAEWAWRSLTYQTSQPLRRN